jgi:hypothetical protein
LEKNNYTPEKLLQIFENIYADIINGKYFQKEILKIKPNIEIPVIKSEQIIEPNTETIVKEIIQIINTLEIPFWLLNDSCLETLIYKNIVTKKFSIGVKSIIDKNNIINSLIKYSTFLEIAVEPNRETKVWGLYGFTIKVPSPLVKYLENYTHKPWKEIMKNG